MAHPMTIEESLREFVTNWGRGQEHVNKLLSIWLYEFAQTPDKVLSGAIRRLMRESTASFIPPLGVVRDYVLAENNGSVGIKSYNKCNDCNQHGMRWVAIHYNEAPKSFSRYHGQPFCYHFTCACSCDLGKAKKETTIETIVNNLDNAMARHNRIRYYYINGDGKPLTSQESTLEETWQQNLEQIRSRGVNPYRKAISRLLPERTM